MYVYFFSLYDVYVLCGTQLKCGLKILISADFFMIETSGAVLPPPPSTPRNDAI